MASSQPHPQQVPREEGVGELRRGRAGENRRTLRVMYNSAVRYLVDIEAGRAVRDGWAGRGRAGRDWTLSERPDQHTGETCKN